MRKVWIIYSLFLLMGFNLKVSAHEIKMSICEITYEQDKEQVLLRFAFFADDYINILTGTSITYDEVSEKHFNKVEPHVFSDYVLKHFTFSINDKKQKMKVAHVEFVRRRVQIDFTISFKNLSSIKKIDIFNDLVIEVFDNQSNLVKLKLSDEMLEALLFTKDVTTQTVVF